MVLQLENYDGMSNSNTVTITTFQKTIRNFVISRFQYASFKKNSSNK